MWLYFVVGQAGWFVCVLSAARGVAWIGGAFVLATVVWHATRVAAPVPELKLVATAVLIGALEAGPFPCCPLKPKAAFSE
ncbi:MAG: DUF2878 family protein [Paraburkholderia fungorum]|nr:DUF2878 family protein [Paraburkholderia fungorum]